MAELVFATVFDTHICRKKLAGRQTFEKTDDLNG